ncbi:sodium:solute symporter [Candidatus Latescibacterota bacterium]
MAGLHIIDIAIIAVYLTSLLVVGLHTARSVKNTGDFFIGGRRFGKGMMAMLGFGTSTHADNVVAVISKSYQVGLAGIWYEWLWLLLTPFYWITIPIVRRIRVVTTADFFLKRYNRTISTLYAVMAIVIMMLTIGIMLLASGRIIEALTGGQVSYVVSIVGMTVMFVMYGIAGGLVSAIYTDVIQGVLTFILSFIILPFGLIRVGGLSGLHEKLANAPHDLFSLIVPGEITVFFIVMMSVNALVGWPVHPQRFLSVGAARTDWDVRMGSMIGVFFKRVSTVAWAFAGLCILALIPGLDNSDHAFGEGALVLLPAGLVGLFLASVIASVQSSCDAFMVAAAGTFTRNIYRVYIRKTGEDSHYLMVGRVSSLVIVAGSLIFAFTLSGVPRALELFWKVTALMGVPFWLGVAWRRANPVSVWSSFIASGLVFLSFEFDSLTGLSVSLPWQMLSYITAGLIAGLIGGFFTKPQPKEQLDRFFKDLHTPVDTAEILEDDTM